PCGTPRGADPWRSAHRNRRCSGSGTWGSAAPNSPCRTAHVGPRSRTRRYRLPPGPRVPGSGQAAGSTSESWRCSFINQGLVTRAQLRFPDPIIHHTDELVANDAFGIDQEGLRRAVHAQIQPKAPVSITDIELIGVVE